MSGRARAVHVARAVVGVSRAVARKEEAPCYAMLCYASPIQLTSRSIAMNSPTPRLCCCCIDPKKAMICVAWSPTRRCRRQ